MIPSNAVRLARAVGQMRTVAVLGGYVRLSSGSIVSPPSTYTSKEGARPSSMNRLLPSLPVMCSREGDRAGGRGWAGPSSSPCRRGLASLAGSSPSLSPLHSVFVSSIPRLVCIILLGCQLLPGRDGLTLCRLISWLFWCLLGASFASSFFGNCSSFAESAAPCLPLRPRPHSPVVRPLSLDTAAKMTIQSRMAARVWTRTSCNQAPIKPSYHWGSEASVLTALTSSRRRRASKTLGKPSGRRGPPHALQVPYMACPSNMRSRSRL